MQCPRCNTDMAENEKCGKCGFNVAENRKDLEVEYKDFKTSELLDIRQKRHARPFSSETKIIREPPEKTLKDESFAEPLPEYKKSFFSLLAVVGLVLALFIGGFILVRFLILR